MSAPRKPFWARCAACGHCWPLAYLPMAAVTAAQVMRRAACPACGESKNIFAAKQNDGTLNEAAANGANA